MPTKLGLALSGGGFRASFFHLGVLAQLAEAGLLRHVEAISAVSGGAIIAALYYLHLKRLLEEKPDAEITDADYTALVQTVIGEFLQATEQNLRMLTFADFTANWKMRRPDYSRSDRLAALYDQWLYRKAAGKNWIEMRELKIRPPGFPHFHPYYHNWLRRAKVPVLVLNATTLNTGRNWQFTARTMGEPKPTWRESDSLPIRLRRAPDYRHMVLRQQYFTLAHAVAASSAVPALLHPLSLSDLYRSHCLPVRVQLVDGGVHDNLGISALVDEGCTHFAISDASGQLGFEKEPETSPAFVLARTAAILQERIRQESLNRLVETRGRENVAFVHLRQGLAVRELAWIGQDDQPAEKDQIIFPAPQCPDIAPEVQEHLARIRTDLDAFTEVEAYSLMLAGFLLSRRELADRRNLGYPPSQANHLRWPFLAIGRWMKTPSADYLRQLEVGRLQFGKTLLLYPSLLAGSATLVLLGLVALWPVLAKWLSLKVSLGAIAAGLGLVALDQLAHKLARGRLAPLVPVLAYLPLGWYPTFRRIVLRAVPPVVGTLFVRAYLRFINPLFLNRGRLANLK
nr:patatin [uncultured Gammaproteobacteria bacterium]